MRDHSLLRKSIFMFILTAFLFKGIVYSEENTNVKRPEIFAPYVSAPFTVDGNSADWTDIKALGEGVTFYKGDGNEGTSASNLGTTIRKQVDDRNDLSCSVWVVHDGNYLYVLAEITDDDWNPFDSENRINMCYQEDMLRIMIDSNNSRTPDIEECIENHPGYEGFGFSTDGNIYGDWSDFNSSGLPKQHPPKGSTPDGTYWKAECRVISFPDKKKNLYIYEERIALDGWPGRNMEKLYPGKSYGFNIEACDADDGEYLQGYILWASDGTTSSWKHQNLWGTMHLAPVPYE
ncbi:sugar-binding protein [Candidatus Omnitrophota bacterium]